MNIHDLIFARGQAAESALEQLAAEARRHVARGVRAWCERHRWPANERERLALEAMIEEVIGPATLEAIQDATEAEAANLPEWAAPAAAATWNLAGINAAKAILDPLCPDCEVRPCICPERT